MPNPNLTALTVALLTTAGFFAAPAFSQTAADPSLSSAQATTVRTETPTPQLAQAQNAEVEAARELIEKLGPLQSNGEAFYTTFSTSAVEGFQSQISRSLTDSERQQLYNFWYRQVQTSLSSEDLKERLVTVYVDEFTLEELTAINAFYETPAGLKWEAVLPGMQQTLGTMSSDYLLALAADETWLNGTLNDLLTEIPSLADTQTQQ